MARSHVRHVWGSTESRPKAALPATSSQTLSGGEVLLENGHRFPGYGRRLRVTGSCLRFVLLDALLVVADQRLKKRFVERSAV